MRQTACWVLLLVSPSVAQVIDDTNVEQQERVAFEFQETALNFWRFQRAVGDPLSDRWTSEELASALQAEHLQRERDAMEILNQVKQLRDKAGDSNELWNLHHRLITQIIRDFPTTKAAAEAIKYSQGRYRFGFIGFTR